MNKRVEEFFELYNNKLLTQQQIADKFGLSRARVKAILATHPDYHPIPRAERKKRRNRAIRKAYTTTDTPIKEIIAEFDVSPRTFFYIVQGLERPKKPCRIVQ